ncbi:hypothetical protein AB0F77_14265 [Streptomyces sp. NPDC026672]|uniref:hypothetical protein n=1 Tax=unclassified Streptomyces TaxID=2593676 RepID=UPI0033D500D8
MNRPPVGIETPLTGGGVRPGDCSDLLDDFLDKIRDMETEYLRAARESYGAFGRASVAPPGTRASDGTS